MRERSGPCSFGDDMKLSLRLVITVLVLAASLSGKSRAQTTTPNVNIIGQIQGANGLPASNVVLSFTPTQPFSVAGPATGGCGSSAVIQLNTVNLVKQCLLNFSSTTPSAPAGNVNITFQTDSAGNLSAYVPVGGGSGSPGGSNQDNQIN